MAHEVARLGTLEPMELADYILCNFGIMSHLKLQKLMFYAHAYHLAYFKKPLITGRFEAWVHGPVCRDVFYMFQDESILYSDLGYSSDERYADINEVVNWSINSSQLEVLTSVLNHFKDWSGIELENLIYSEAPWKDSRGELPKYEPSSAVISDESIISYYKQFI